MEAEKKAAEGTEEAADTSAINTTAEPVEAAAADASAASSAADKVWLLSAEKLHARSCRVNTTVECMRTALGLVMILRRCEKSYICLD